MSVVNAKDVPDDVFLDSQVLDESLIGGLKSVIRANLEEQRILSRR